MRYINFQSQLKSYVRSENMGLCDLMPKEISFTIFWYVELKVIQRTQISSLFWPDAKSQTYWYLQDANTTKHNMCLASTFLALWRLKTLLISVLLTQSTFRVGYLSSCDNIYCKIVVSIRFLYA